MNSTARVQFRFGLITVAALVVVAVGLLLGRWQLSRAAQKETLQAHVVAQTARPPLTSQDVLTLNSSGASATMAQNDLFDRTLTLQGTWLPQYTVYLDNRQMNAKQGFFVLTPLKLTQTDRVVMVQRGWVQRDFTDRERLPELITPEGSVRITGRIAAGPAHLLDLLKAKPDELIAPNRIRQNLSLSAYQSETQLPLWDHLLVQTDAMPDGLLRDWAAPSFGIEKHYGYAFQWFGLSALMAILYVWFQLVPQFRKQPV